MRRIDYMESSRRPGSLDDVKQTRARGRTVRGLSTKEAQFFVIPREKSGVTSILKVLDAAEKRILSIGSSGDFVKVFRIAKLHPNIVVTFQEENKGTFLDKYPSAAENLKEMENREIEMHFGILPDMLGLFCGPLGIDEERKFDYILFVHKDVDINRVDHLKKNKGINLLIKLLNRGFPNLTLT